LLLRFLFALQGRATLGQASLVRVFVRSTPGALWLFSRRRSSSYFGRLRRFGRRSFRCRRGRGWWGFCWAELWRVQRQIRAELDRNLVSGRGRGRCGWIDRRRRR